METIRNYLENMFMNLPNSTEVLRAKDELLQMMEDKYTELKDEGETENEAVGIVISEFGNLDDLADDLGIDAIVREEAQPLGRALSMEEIKKCLHDYKKRALLMAIGVFLCICSPVVSILGDAFGQMGMQTEVLEAVGVFFLFSFVAIAVGLFIFAGEVTKRFSYMEMENCQIDFAAAQAISDKKAEQNGVCVFQLVLGIMFCILSILPTSMTDLLTHNEVLEDASASILFVMVAIGVFLIVFSQAKNTGYHKLLSLNNQKTVGGNYVKEQKKQIHYKNKNVEMVMSVFWPTITCIYLCWSFLTYDWWFTWIIWPLASFVEYMVKAIFKEEV